MRRPSFLTRIAGEHRLPGGRVASLALVLALAACSAPAVSSGPSGAAPSPSAFPPVPTLGGPAPSGIVLPTYFVTVLESRHGLLSLVTTPGSICTAEAAMPDGTQGASSELRAPRTADASGRVTFEYRVTPVASGAGIHTVSCALADQRQQARARFDVK